MSHPKELEVYEDEGEELTTGEKFEKYFFQPLFVVAVLALVVVSVYTAIKYDESVWYKDMQPITLQSETLSQGSPGTCCYTLECIESTNNPSSCECFYPASACGEPPAEIVEELLK